MRTEQAEQQWQHLVDSTEVELSEASVQLDKEQAELTKARAATEVARTAVAALMKATTDSMDTLKGYLKDHAPKPGFSEANAKLAKLLMDWRLTWASNERETTSHTRNVWSFTQELRTAQYVSNHATKNFDRANSEITGIRSKMEESLHEMAAEENALHLKETHLAETEAALVREQALAAEVRKQAIALAQDLAANAAASVDAAESAALEEKANAQYREVIEQVKTDMQQEHQLSLKAGRVQGRLDNLKAKIDQLTAGMLEVQEDKAEQEKRVTEAHNAEQFAQTEDEQNTAKVHSLAIELGLPPLKSQRQSSLTIHEAARQTEAKSPEEEQIPVSVSASPVFRNALASAGKLATREVESTEAKRMYTKLSLVREQTFGKLEHQRAQNSELAKKLSLVQTELGKLQTLVQGMAVDEQMAENELATEETELVQSQQEEVTALETLDSEEDHGVLLADELGEAEVAVQIAKETEEVAAQNALIEEGTAVSISHEAAEEIAQDGDHVQHLVEEVSAVRQKAIELATNLDNANAAASDAAQTVAAAKADGDAARLEQEDIKAQAAQITHDAELAFNQTIAKIDTQQELVESLEENLQKGIHDARLAEDEARVDVDFNFTITGIKARALATKTMITGMKEGIAELVNAELEDVHLDYLEPCDVMDWSQSKIPFCNFVFTHVNLKNREAADGAVDVIEAQAAMDGAEGLTSKVQRHWSKVGRFAPIAILLNETAVHEPALPWSYQGWKIGPFDK
jgi:hypothetical protein